MSQKGPSILSHLEMFYHHFQLPSHTHIVPKSRSVFLFSQVSILPSRQGGPELEIGMKNSLDLILFIYAEYGGPKMAQTVVRIKTKHNFSHSHYNPMNIYLVVAPMKSVGPPVPKTFVGLQCRATI